MSILEKLPNLRILVLDTEAFKGNQMVCSRGGFPQLESLSILRQVYLKEWRVEEGGLARLCSLHISDCDQLQRLPDGLKDITCLKELVIEKMPSLFIKRIDKGGEDFYKVQLCLCDKLSSYYFLFSVSTY